MGLKAGQTRVDVVMVDIYYTCCKLGLEWLVRVASQAGQIKRPAPRGGQEFVALYFRDVVANRVELFTDPPFCLCGNDARVVPCRWHKMRHTNRTESCRRNLIWHPPSNVKEKGRRFPPPYSQSFYSRFLFSFSDVNLVGLLFFLIGHWYLLHFQWISPHSIHPCFVLRQAFRPVNTDG